MIQRLHAEVLQGLPEPKRGILRSVSQFRGKILPAVRGCRVRKLRQRRLLEKSHGECVKWIPSASVSRPGEGKPPRSVSPDYPGLSQDWQDASPNQRSFPRACRAQHQHKAFFTCHLLLQNIEQFSNGSGSAAEKRSMFGIKELQATIRVYFPVMGLAKRVRIGLTGLELLFKCHRGSLQSRFAKRRQSCWCWLDSYITMRITEQK